MESPPGDDGEILTSQCKGHSRRPTPCEQRKRLLRNSVRHLGSALILLTSTGFLLLCLVSAKLLLLVYTSELRWSKERQAHNGMYQDQSHSHVTWTLTWAVCAPSLLTFIVRVANLNQEHGRRLSVPQFLLASAGAAAHTVSLSLMVFRVLPSLDIFRGFFATLAFGAASSIIHTLLIDERSGRSSSKTMPPFAVGILLVFGHIFGWLMFAGRWSSDDSLESTSNGNNLWQFPVAIFTVLLERIAYLLIRNSSDGCCLLTTKRSYFNRTSYRILPVLVELCKVGLFITFAIVLSGEGRAYAADDNTQIVTRLLPHGENDKRPSPASETPVMSREGEIRNIMAYMKGYPSATFILLPLAFAFAGGICARLQPVALSISTTLASPFSLISLIFWFLQGEGLAPVAAVKGAYPDLGKYDLFMYSLWFLPLWLFQLWILWKQKSESRTPVRENFLLLLSSYTALLPESTLLEHALEKGMSRYVASSAVVMPDAVVKEVSRDASNPMVYVCATVWHEQQHEMLRMLASVVRLDEDQARRRHAQAMLSEIYQTAACTDPSYYTFEAHVFIDDAMELVDDNKWTINSHAKRFVKTVDLAVSAVFGPSMKLSAPSKCNTPYGGRLVWTLPGGNKMFAHLKDKNKVRIRKRWSQIMYTHYLFEYRRFEQDNVTDKYVRHSDIFHDEILTSDSAEQFRSTPLKVCVDTNGSLTRDDDTYFLAVDGDVDFRPDDVLRLVGCLKRDARIGVACGRIHPIGKGPVVWYQQFEYAFSHWLQKSAEQVLGCVLCAPGAFSLFRASALMDDGVADAYASLASEARHYVQYEQGEDRWLTSLLMQNGYRVEYVADAAALSHAPESLAEFFSQRRRWNPSTVTHTVDFLFNWRKMRSINNDITATFVVYQAVVFSTWCLSPASITALVAGGLNTALGMRLETSFVIAAAIPASYAVVCFTASQTAQVNFAAILNAASALLMAALVVTLLPHVSEVSLTSVWGLFLILEVTVFTTAAAFHPREFACLLHGVLYYLCIVTGYVLLVIYSVANLHLVSWGTREEQPRQIAANNWFNPASARQHTLNHAAQDSNNNYEQSSKASCDVVIDMEAAPSGLQSHEQEVTATSFTYVRLASPDKRELSDGEITDKNWIMSNKNAPTVSASCHVSDTRSCTALGAKEAARMSVPQGPMRFGNKTPPSTEDLVVASWMNEPCLRHASVLLLSEKEIQYWNSLISSLLQPLPQDTARDAQMEADLRRLRYVVCCIFFTVNAIWMTVIYCLQAAATLVDDSTGSQSDDNGDAGLTAPTDNPLFSIMLTISAAVLAAQYLCMLQHRYKHVASWFNNVSLPQHQFASIEQQQLTLGRLKFKLPLYWCDHVAAQTMVDALAVVRAFHYDTGSGEESEDCNNNVTLAIKIWRKSQCAKRLHVAACSDRKETMSIGFPVQQEDSDLRNRFKNSMYLLRKHMVPCRNTNIAHHRKDEHATYLPEPWFGAPLQCDACDVQLYKPIQDPCWSKSLGQVPSSQCLAHLTVQR